MSSISLLRLPRRLQLLLGVVVLVAVLWVAVLHKAVSNSGSGESSSPVARRAPQAAPAATPRVKPGPLASRSRTATTVGSGAVRPRQTVGRKAAVPSVQSPSGKASKGGQRAAGANHAAPAPASLTPAQEVARELGEGKVALVLFWDPASATDRYVAAELNAFARRHGREANVHLATPSQLSAYAPYSDRVLISETPTILVIGARNQVSTLTGYTEQATLERAVALARRRAAIG